MGGIRRDRTVGIGALGGILKRYRGAVGRDLIVAGYTWADVGTAKLPYDQFISFVMHAPEGTAVFFERFNGWTVTDHLITDQLEVLDMLLWTKTKDARKNRNRPKRRQRPSPESIGKKQQPQKQQTDDSNQVMTVADYVKRTGMNINLEGR